MPYKTRVAAVTGARGLIGKEIVNRLLKYGWKVKVLTRSSIDYNNINVSVVVSDINNIKGLNLLLNNADAVFHCAGEINDKNKMYLTNVEGTKNLLEAIKNSSISYFCHISSAGVIGSTNDLVVTEETVCNPIGVYEKTKYESEQLVLKANLKINTVILRPTNVFSATRLGIFISLPIVNSWKEKLKVLVSGKECAHVVDVFNVAKSALFFLNDKVLNTRIYFVSSDDDKVSTTIEIYNSYMSINERKKINFALPVYMPHVMRRIFKGHSLYGKIRFSSNKIKRSGFTFERSVENSLRIISSKVEKNRHDFSAAYEK